MAPMLPSCLGSRHLLTAPQHAPSRSAGSKDNARVWVKYENGHEGPLEPQLLGNRQAGM
jgi:hypothetical protein